MVRRHYLEKIHRQFEIHPACGIVGPRQVGKTTLAKAFIEEYANDEAVFFDLENPIDAQRLEDPITTLGYYTNQFIVIDEIQRRPDLFAVLRVLIDEKKGRKFLLLGSASPTLQRQSSESLTGRIGYIELPPFSLEEVKDSFRLWLRGGFPLSYLAESNENSFLWRESYITTFLERDIPNLGYSMPPTQMGRFWRMLAHYHGQVFNASALGQSMGLSDHTVRKYLDILAGTFMIRILPAWYENVMKQQIKSPKIYFKDSGMLNALLNLATKEQLLTYPNLGAFWEGFAVEEIIRISQASSQECFFWDTRSAELDLLIVRGGKRVGFECKYSDVPKVTKSMHTALEDLKLDHLVVVYPGKSRFPLTEKITACGLEILASSTDIRLMNF